MNRERIEAQLGALMDEATPKDTPKDSTQTAAPRATPGKAMTAALMLVAALIGALVAGLFRPATVPQTGVNDIVKTIEDEDGKAEKSRIDVFFFNIGVGRYRK